MRILRTNKYAQEIISNAPINKKTLIRRIYKALEPVTKGIFRDESWQAISSIRNILDSMGLDWNITDAYYGNGRYDKTLPSESKTWKFEIDFTNQRGRPDKIYGNIIASGMGSVQEPLEKYDIIVTMS